MLWIWNSGPYFTHAESETGISSMHIEICSSCLRDLILWFIAIELISEPIDKINVFGSILMQKQDWSSRNISRFFFFFFFWDLDDKSTQQKHRGIKTRGLPWWLSGKDSTCSAEDPGSILGSGRPPEKGMATHSSILAWEIPWGEDPGGLSMELQTSRHHLASNHTHTWRLEHLSLALRL